MSFHAGQTFTFGEQPSATKWQYLWDNDYALADGTGISDNAILNRHLASGIVGSAEMAAQPSPTALSFNSGWTDYGGGFKTGCYYKDSMGIVHLHGLVKRVSGSSGSIATLPSGYRPVNGTIGFPASTDTGIGNFQVTTAGVLNLVSGGTGFVYIDGWTFIAGI